jgi:dUTP pyrophosphatase
MSYTLIVEPSTPAARALYENHTFFHNGDCGVDLFVMNDVTVTGGVTFINHEIKCKMIDPSGNQCGYYLYPRSSISKLPLMLANHVGIIDGGYRGDILAAVRYLPFADGRTDHVDFGKQYTVGGQTRLFQICAPTLGPISLVVLPEGEHLDETTRGSGGFGSTGA